MVRSLQAIPRAMSGFPLLGKSPGPRSPESENSLKIRVLCPQIKTISTSLFKVILSAVLVSAEEARRLRFLFLPQASNEFRIALPLGMRVLPCYGCRGPLCSRGREDRILTPSSDTDTNSLPPTLRNRTCALAAPLCFFRLRSPSWTMRNKHKATSG
jgi:hypothetical protein